MDQIEPPYKKIKQEDIKKTNTEIEFAIDSIPLETELRVFYGERGFLKIDSIYLLKIN